MTPDERFWAKVDKSGDCWLWTASTDSTGYGKFKLNGRMRGSHRYSYESSYGPIPEGFDLDHMCHVRTCVRPIHLRAVTHKQNLENLKGAARTNPSGARGVSWYSRTNKWLGRVRHNGKLHHVGYFDTIEAASYAVTTRRNELFTHNDLDRSTK